MIIHMPVLDTSRIHPSWLPYVKKALTAMDPHYLRGLECHSKWLPGPDLIFNAFSQPFSRVKYILFGESPYPRADSANGYAFWDARVQQIWAASGLSAPVNRATSLRNLIKMLLVAEGALDFAYTSQAAIAALEKKYFVQTLAELFQQFLDQGFLLLNASLVLSDQPVKNDAKRWLPFMRVLLSDVCNAQPTVRLLLFGKIAKRIDSFNISFSIPPLYAEHPYNLSFIQQKAVVDFFKPLHLIVKK